MVKQKKLPEVFRVGSFAVLATTGRYSVGGKYPALRVEIGMSHTTLDSYEVLRLKSRLERWLTGGLSE